MRQIGIDLVGAVVTVGVKAKTGNDFVSTVASDLSKTILGEIFQERDDVDPKHAEFKQFTKWVQDQLNLLPSQIDRMQTEKFGDALYQGVGGNLQNADFKRSRMLELYDEFPYNFTSEEYEQYEDLNEGELALQYNSWSSDDKQHFGEFKRLNRSLTRMLGLAWDKCDQLQQLFAGLASSASLYQLWSLMPTSGTVCISVSSQSSYLYSAENKAPPDNSMVTLIDRHERHVREWIRIADELTTNVIKWRESFIKYNYEKHEDLLWCDCTKTLFGNPWCSRVTRRWTNWYFEDGNGDNCNRPTKIGVFGSYANHSPTKNHGAPDQLCGHRDPFVDNVYVEERQFGLLKSTILRGFKDTILPSWGSDYTETWKYFLPENVGLGKKPKIVRRERVGITHKGRSWTQIGVRKYSPRIVRITRNILFFSTDYDRAVVKIDTRRQGPMKIMASSENQVPIWWHEHGVLKSFISTPSENSTYICFTEVLLSEDMTHIHFVTSEFDDEWKKVKDNSPEPPISDNRDDLISMEPPTTREGDFGCLKGLYIFHFPEDEDNFNPFVSGFLQITPVWLVESYQ